MENKVELVKQIIKDNIEQANCGIFDSRNIVGDPMTTIYRDAEVQVDICFNYAYFEIFGLTAEEFDEVEMYYNSIH